MIDPSHHPQKVSEPARPAGTMLGAGDGDAHRQLLALSEAARDLFAAMPSHLQELSGVEFGRSIEERVRCLRAESLDGYQLKLRQKDAAVVMQYDRYLELVQQIEGLKTQIDEALRTRTAHELDAKADAFDALMARMNTPEAVQAAEDLATVSAEELRANYRPGRTERDPSSA